MQPIELDRMRAHKVHEMDSPVPLLGQLSGLTRDDMGACGATAMSFAMSGWTRDLLCVTRPRHSRR
jgi:hypothetical protein